MRPKLILLFVVFVLCPIVGAAQTLNEKDSSLVIQDGTARFSLVVDNPGVTGDRPVDLDVIDQYDRVLTQGAGTINLRTGKGTYTVDIPAGELKDNTSDNIFWYRLRYRLAGKTGFISLSNLFKDVFDLQVASPEFISPGALYRVRVRGVHSFSRQPIKKIQITAELKLELIARDEDAEDKLDLIASGITDGDGFAILDFKIPSGVRLDHDCDLIVTGIKNSIVREVNDSLRSGISDGAVFLTSDKPLYQPGQSFNVRGIYFDGENNIVPGHELEFTIKDENGITLYREKVKTSDYGIASITWKIPENAKLGAYSVNVDAGDVDLDYDRHFFKVSRYDLPQFTVAAAGDRPFYLPGQNTASVKISADYLFGKPVANGRVRVVEEKERRWSYYKQRYEFEESQTFEGQTGADGKFTFDLELAKEHAELKGNDNQFKDLNFSAYFTDASTNRTEQRRFDIRVSRDPIHIYAQAPNFSVDSRMPFVGYIAAFYADGTPAACNLTVRAGDVQVAKVKTNSHGVAKLSFETPKQFQNGDYKFQIRARDKSGRTGKFDDDITVRDRENLSVDMDKAIYLSGENMLVNIRSSKPDIQVFVDIAERFSVIGSYRVDVKNGKAVLTIPYDRRFKGELTIGAYYYDNDEKDTIQASRGVLFPEAKDLSLTVDFSGRSYRPGEEVKLTFSVHNNVGKPTESALGIVAFDRAVEERAKSDGQSESYFSRFYDLLRLSSSFGGYTLKDLNAIDLRKPVTADMQLAAEGLLWNNYFPAQISQSRLEHYRGTSLYSSGIEKQLAPIQKILRERYSTNYEHPTDEASLKKILVEYSVDLDRVLDPWNEKFHAVFAISGTTRTLDLVSSGPDKTLGSDDDIRAFYMYFQYFAPVGVQLDKTVSEYKSRTGKFIVDRPTLEAELARNGIDLNELKDPWGNPYLVNFDISKRNYLLTVSSLGKAYQFEVWRAYVDYFADSEHRLNQILSKHVFENKKPFPTNTAEFRAVLTENNVDMETLRDAYNEILYVEERRPQASAAAESITFALRSRGRDRIQSDDDFDVSTFSKERADKLGRIYYPETKITVSPSQTSALNGVVVDANGAVVPAASVKIINKFTPSAELTTTTNDEGIFVFRNIVPSTYSVWVDASGFKKTVVENIVVKTKQQVELTVILEVGAVTETVMVTSGGEVLMSASATVGTTVKSKSKIGFHGTEQASTPRLREYFPETLVWNPELVTDKRGRAELKFKLADNITTWKLYTIASSKNGKIGISEKEITAFQPFFVDLEPPKFLTEGDEIDLPATVRNYTEKKQNVAVTMDKSNWFAFTGVAKQQIAIDAGASQNAVFGFRAVSPIKNGKQKVTALAQRESDAIEKLVTVRPNGKEIVRSEMKLFNNSATFQLDFPASSQAATRSAELKIYPNLFAHVTESVEGLLKRPYGCGEQTISSTYPNLMILKFSKDDNKLTRTARSYLQRGYERLVGYQVEDGGFSYWGGKDTSNLALTAYALRFLNDADGIIEVDEEVVERAESWLAKQQRPDGSFPARYYYGTNDDIERQFSFTAYTARILAGMSDGGKKDPVLTKALDYLNKHAASISDPHSLALYGLALADSGDIATAKIVARRLELLAKQDGGGSFWAGTGTTPFNGWGITSAIETTALVAQLFTKLKNAGVESGDAAGAMTYLLRNKDRYGVWYSTQTTINVLDTFLMTIKPGSTSVAAQPLQVLLNGSVIKEINITANQVQPATVELSGPINADANEIEVRSTSDTSLSTQLVSTHYVPWGETENSRSGQENVKLNYTCDKQNVEIMQEVNCSVQISQARYGMMLAEIGIPPGANVSRESLEKAREIENISRYDILPDRIVVYLWAKTGGNKFNFSFRPRYGINAQTPASIAYDYYNPEAQATLAPLKFVVK